jgi:hypothetical protein
MIKHIVMLRLNEYPPEEKKENLQKLKKMIEGLMGVVPELKFMEVGLNVNKKPSAYDLVLTSHFDSEEALDAYRVHPEHKKVLDFLFKVTKETAVVDYSY